MKKLTLKSSNTTEETDIFTELLSNCANAEEFIIKGKGVLSRQNIEFYTNIGLILGHIGIAKPSITREGDVNCRMDAIIIDDNNSIPIEIKSPGETVEVNIKSIRQALENKVVILSRKFYRTTYDTTSLAIAFSYPPKRSDVYELINDIKTSFNFNIGIIDIQDLLTLVYDVKVNNRKLNMKYFNSFLGRFGYEKAFAQREY